MKKNIFIVEKISEVVRKDRRRLYGKEIRFSKDARKSMLKGVDTLVDIVKVTIDPKVATWCATGAP